ncbi:MAG: glycoside hydrolase family 43 protein [Candidatus Coatesbacteria bacterium]
MKYRNPVLSGFHPDPSVCRVGRDFYLVTSSFEYFPGVPVFHSRDLVHWDQLGHCLTRESQLPLRKAGASQGVFAPTIRHHRGLFYMTTTNVSAGGNFIVTANHPAGPWSEPVMVRQEGIDPSLFFDDDGSVYYTTSRDGALQSRIDVKTGALLTEPKVVWPGTGGQYPEAPHLYRRREWYYLMIAEGGTEYGHMVTIARSTSPWGPFTPCPRNPILTHRSFRSPIQVLGHADLVEAESGEWSAVFLGVRPVGYPPCYHLGRETFLSPVTWAEDGFPVIGQQGRIELEMESSLEPAPGPAAAARDDFDSLTLGPQWNFLRNPDPACYSLAERPSHLRLRGSAHGLGDIASPAWVGRRQRHFSLRAAACLEFSPETENEEAGLVARMNETHHYEIFVTRRGTMDCVVLRRRIGSLHAEVACEPLSAGTTSRIILAIDADRERYRFLYGAAEGGLKCLGQGETRYLSTEVAGGFTGVYLAMYASGNGSPCKRPADFDWFDYQEHDEPSR